MPGPVNTLLIEGSFEELCDELATYVDSLGSAQGQQTSIQSEIQSLLQEDKKDDALKRIVAASPVLSTAPEREFIAAYNLLVHLVRQSSNIEIFLPRICNNLSQPITSSPQNSTGLALSVLTTIFNTLPPTQDSRYHVLLAILKVIRSHSAFDQLRPQLRNLDLWLESWDMDKEDQRKLYLAVSDVATDAGESDQSYQYLLKALRTTQDGDEASSEEAKTLSIKALSHALSSPQTFDFSELTQLDSIQSLRKSSAAWFELLEIFSSQTLEDYADFAESNTEFFASASLSTDALERKIRLLTLASLSASASQTRTLAYSQIASALRIPTEDVEMWVIDVIRAGLVEGKLSQSTQTFLIHRSTYRVFGENQWREVASRLDMWRSSLVGVLGVIRQEKEQYIRDKEQELRDAESGPKGMGYRPRNYNRNTVEVE